VRDRNADGNTTTGTGGLEERVYALQDANWNTTAIIAAAGVPGMAAGAVINRFIYAPYGRSDVLTAAWATAGASTPTPWAHRFQGLEFTDVTNLFHARNRDYSFALGRFIQLDPIGFSAGDSNWYRFVGNGPTGKVDPSGLEGLRLPVATSGCTPGVVTWTEPSGESRVYRPPVLVPKSPTPHPLNTYPTQAGKDFVVAYNELQKHQTGDQLTKSLIIELMKSRKSPTELLGVVIKFREWDDGKYDSETLAELDHFFTSFSTADDFPRWPMGGAGSGVPTFIRAFGRNQGYCGLKPLGFVPLDKKNIPPSVLTYEQYRWGNRGASAAQRFRSNVWNEPAERKQFLDWLHGGWLVE
jgi:RHS repeat-associated protein